MRMFYARPFFSLRAADLVDGLLSGLLNEHTHKLTAKTNLGPNLGFPNIIKRVSSTSQALLCFRVMLEYAWLSVTYSRIVYVDDPC